MPTLIKIELLFILTLEKLLKVAKMHRRPVSWAIADYFSSLALKGIADETKFLFSGNQANHSESLD
jgi:hypothetical protein